MSDVTHTSERGTELARPGLAADYVIPDRRSGRDRRRFSLRTLVRGGLAPRRRGPRRVGEVPPIVDWHQPHLVVLALVVLLLSITDAFLTLTLLGYGAHEANPFLAYVLHHQPVYFASLKMALTGAGVIVLVVLARAKVFYVVRVSSILHWCVIGYGILIGYELWLLGKLM